MKLNSIGHAFWLPFLPEMRILWEISETDLLELLVPLPHLDNPPEGFSSEGKWHLPWAETIFTAFHYEG